MFENFERREREGNFKYFFRMFISLPFPSSPNIVLVSHVSNNIRWWEILVCDLVNQLLHLQSFCVNKKLGSLDFLILRPVAGYLMRMYKF